MKFAEDVSDSAYVVTAYDEKGISVNGKRFQQSMIVSPQRFEENWSLQTIESLAVTHIEQLVAYSPELIILGTGSKLVFPEVALYATCIQRNIGIEFMDTGAACRTYNILTGENRNVVAGLIIET